ncbi:SIR2 family protein [Paraflavitalea sp. CAU 1676]|uniref:SIR2 family protein n=1 Tax=Paraflavitalea sp. CAU 1676 TaxID=3032598 RepID=UPI0023DAB72D|nr:SIR2 family protein [Paraflavitalea sp. CAU 1676]MDF2190557.1 SIR2 family protein [Paraflavitalea sp. CAU 1676]
MNNYYGLNLEEYMDDVDKCIDLLSSYLKQGCLGLMLGSGASKGLDLPDWTNLVSRCAKEVLPGYAITTDTDLKRASSKIKDKSGLRYLSLVKEKLYEGIEFDFGMAKKDLLIAITSLMVGKMRGNVNHIVTYNFDSVLEWYLQTNGLSVKNSSPLDLFKKFADVEITHIHGYLPHSPEFGDDSSTIVFSKEEFEDRETIDSYWRVIMDEYYRHHVFLTIGLSPESIEDDICRYLRAANAWYEKEKLVRDQPYGIAFITSYKNVDEQEFKEKAIKHGIIPCTLQKEKIPPNLFRIAQSALNNR